MIIIKSWIKAVDDLGGFKNLGIIGQGVAIALLMVGIFATLIFVIIYFLLKIWVAFKILQVFHLL